MQQKGALEVYGRQMAGNVGAEGMPSGDATRFKGKRR